MKKAFERCEACEKHRVKHNLSEAPYGYRCFSDISCTLHYRPHNTYSPHKSVLHGGAIHNSKEEEALTILPPSGLFRHTCPRSANQHTCHPSPQSAPAPHSLLCHERLSSTPLNNFPVPILNFPPA